MNEKKIGRRRKSCPFLRLNVGLLGCLCERGIQQDGKERTLSKRMHDMKMEEETDNVRTRDTHC
jgi:uncharacterized protein YceH (UPF0502 family)